MACTFMKQATSVRLYIIRMELALDRSVQIRFVQVYALDEKGFCAGRHAFIKNDMSNQDQNSIGTSDRIDRIKTDSS